MKDKRRLYAFSSYDGGDFDRIIAQNSDQNFIVVRIDSSVVIGIKDTILGRINDLSDLMLKQYSNSMIVIAGEALNSSWGDAGIPVYNTTTQSFRVPLSTGRWRWKIITLKDEEPVIKQLRDRKSVV